MRHQIGTGGENRHRTMTAFCSWRGYPARQKRESSASSFRTSEKEQRDSNEEALHPRLVSFDWIECRILEGFFEVGNGRLGCGLAWILIFLGFLWGRAHSGQRRSNDRLRLVKSFPDSIGRRLAERALELGEEKVSGLFTSGLVVGNLLKCLDPNVLTRRMRFTML